MDNVIEFPRKAKTHAFIAHLAERDVSEFHIYRCIHCRNELSFTSGRLVKILNFNGDGKVYCDCGATWATDYAEDAGSALGNPLAAIITALEQPYTKQKEARK